MISSPRSHPLACAVGRCARPGAQFQRVRCSQEGDPPGSQPSHITVVWRGSVVLMSFRSRAPATSVFYARRPCRPRSYLMFRTHWAVMTVVRSGDGLGQQLRVPPASAAVHPRRPVLRLQRRGGVSEQARDPESVRRAGRSRVRKPSLRYTGLVFSSRHSGYHGWEPFVINTQCTAACMRRCRNRLTQGCN